MEEEVSGFDFVPVAETVFGLENHEGCTLLDRIQASLRGS